MTYEYKQLIDGGWVDAANGKTWTLLNPATEQPLGEIPFGDGSDAAAAIDAAHRAFPAWAHKTPYERADVLMRAAAWIRARVDALGAITTEECGKPLRESTAEWTTAANLFEWYAEEGKRAYGRIIPARKADRRIMVLYEPVGVVGTITAWNFPVYNIVRTWAAALAAGCTVVGRPSEYTPRSGMLLGRALVEGGAPAGVINVINGDAESQGQAMLRDPRCRKISFTGSTRVGKLLMQGAAETVTKLALELGGNAPVIIFPDAPGGIEAAAKGAVSFKYRNAGQVCIAPQRFYVHHTAVEEFTDQVAQISGKLTLGSGLDKTTDVGPLINAIQRTRVETLVADAIASGAQALTGGARPADMPAGYFYQPTVLVNLSPTMRIYTDEIFGPVLPIVPFSEPEEVLAMANDTEYGLAAYVQTSNLYTAMQMYEGLDYGMVAVNDWLPSTPEAPFGGVKQSGIGRECGKEGLEKYLESKTVFLGGSP
jgi:acyl-CoA reductase-like NAD-dependent aldehyde dehydrogenase